MVCLGITRVEPLLSAMIGGGRECSFDSSVSMPFVTGLSFCSHKGWGTAVTE